MSKSADTRKTFILVTPVFRDSRRLSSFGTTLVQALARSGLAVQWIIADDGSDDDHEISRLQALIEEWRAVYPAISLFDTGIHLGKGGTIRIAWEAHSDAEWLAFVDADGSVGAESVVTLMEKALGIGPGWAVLASRKSSPDTVVRQRLLRKITHRVFAAIARTFLKLPVFDVQCGGKVVSSTAFRSVAPNLVENGFAFDAELLAALSGRGIRFMEVPIDWEEKGGGRVRPFREAGPMLAAIFRVRTRCKKGHYNPCRSDPGSAGSRDRFPGRPQS